MPDNKLPEPWLSFLREIDKLLTEETHFHCLGGFVVVHVYGAPRSTSDLDVLTLVQKNPEILAKAGEGSELHKRHKVYLDPVGVATLPENYEDRLAEVFPGTFRYLKLFALDPYDIALAKLERNIERDRDDVKHLARVVPFDIAIFEQRYHEELRIYVRNDGREDLTLQLWIEMIHEDREINQT